jgi:hypothetical protein
MPECRTATRTGHLMCGEHWRLVPRAAQRRVHATWRGLRNSEDRPGTFTTGLAEYRDAVQAACAAVDAEIARSMP